MKKLLLHFLIFTLFCNFQAIAKNYSINDLTKKNGVFHDEKGPANGLLKYYYPNGKIKSEFNYKNGIQEGLTKHYYENGNIKKYITYKNGVADGVLIDYYETGKLETKAYFKNDKLEGISTYYHENGKIKAETNFVNNKKDGLSKIYYENGKVKKDVIFKNGIPEGPKKQYDINGNLTQKTTFTEFSEIIKQTYQGEQHQLNKADANAFKDDFVTNCKKAFVDYKSPHTDASFFCLCNAEKAIKIVPPDIIIKHNAKHKLSELELKIINYGLNEAMLHCQMLRKERENSKQQQTDNNKKK